ncbi:DEAD/DEAH box helicase family protein [Mycoplasma sp. 480]|uniref:DEAD/DEAH box helicase family protein n=1 Tax=Mycoplasma sp. 480 TaxID=3440155 RepID=UPI003F514D75
MEHKELEFEKSLLIKLKNYGWKNQSIENSQISDTLDGISEKELEQNWRNILFELNKATLNNVPLDDEEFEEIKAKIFNSANKVVEIHSLLQGESIPFQRTNPNLSAEDKKGLIYLKIFSNTEIKAGNTIYQTARQVSVSAQRERRIDVLLLINGLPLFCLELKTANIGIEDAKKQLIQYGKNGVFSTGLLKFVQVLVALTPNNMEYTSIVDDFSNFNIKDFRYWKNKDNQIVNDIDKIINLFFKIPEAHNLISNGTIIKDNKLLITRSYQFYAIKAILDKINEIKYTNENKCGFIWHTTGSGKTLTSFQTASLLLKREMVSTVVFVVDRIDLNEQSFTEFSEFSKTNKDKIRIINTYGIKDLEEKLKETARNSGLFKTIFITSIQKLSQLRKNYFKPEEKIALIFDEAHRSSYGQMMNKIQGEFKNAIFIGFTGTPIHWVNQKNELTTEQVFGPLLHKYTIINGLEDGNVLRFSNNYINFENMLLEFFYKIQCNHYGEAIEVDSTKIKYKLYAWANQGRFKPSDEEIYKLLIHKKILNSPEKIIQIERWLKNNDYYDNDNFKKVVVKDILEHWISTSNNRRYSAILATKKIDDAIKYFKLFQEAKKSVPELAKFTVTALFDKNIDAVSEEEAKNFSKLEEIKNIYDTFEQDFKDNPKVTTANLDENFKSVISKIFKERQILEGNKYPTVILDLLIVVNQMLTGYDSKYINTVFFDKIQENEHLIQSMSRTNRLENANDKPFGSIYFYREPGTMKSNLQRALEIYSGVDNVDIEADSSENLIKNAKKYYQEIEDIFNNWNYPNFEEVPKYDPKSENHILKEQQKRFVGNFTKLEKTLTSLSLLRKEPYKELSNVFNEEDINKLKLRFKEIDLNALRDNKEKDEIEETISDFDLDWMSERTLSTQMIDIHFFEVHFTYKGKVAESKSPINEWSEEEFHQKLAQVDADTRKLLLQIDADISYGKTTIEEIYSQFGGLKQYLNFLKNKELNDDKSTFKATYLIDQDENISKVFDELWDLEESRWKENGRIDTIEKYLKTIKDEQTLKEYILSKNKDCKLYIIYKQFKEDLKNKKIN